MMKNKVSKRKQLDLIKKKGKNNDGNHKSQQSEKKTSINIKKTNNSNHDSKIHNVNKKNAKKSVEKQAVKINHRNGNSSKKKKNNMNLKLECMCSETKESKICNNPITNRPITNTTDIKLKI